jgi:hypothetical protein
MATLNLTVNYPDAQQARILAALKARYANNGNPAPTNAQAIEGLRAEIGSIVRGIVQSYDQQAAAAAVLPPDVT